MFLRVLLQGCFCTDIAPGDLSSVRQCRVELRDPQNFSQDDVSKFVASLALSVHVEATLHSVSQLDRIAVQVCECVELLPVCSSCITVELFL